MVAVLFELSAVVVMAYIVMALYSYGRPVVAVLFELSAVPIVERSSSLVSAAARCRWRRWWWPAAAATTTTSSSCHRAAHALLQWCRAGSPAVHHRGIVNAAAVAEARAAPVTRGTEVEMPGARVYFQKLSGACRRRTPRARSGRRVASERRSR